MSTSQHSEAAFETVIEAHLLQNGYVSIPREGFDRDRAIFPRHRPRLHPRNPARRNGPS